MVKTFVFTVRKDSGSIPDILNHVLRVSSSKLEETRSTFLSIRIS